MLSCIADDLRFATQCEERGWYFSRLALGLRLPAEAIESTIRDEESTLPCDILGAFARRGDAYAVAALRHQVSKGPAWHSALRALADAEPTGCLGLDAIVCDRFDDEALMQEVSSDSGPWTDWALTNPRIARLLDQDRFSAPPERTIRSPRPNWTALTTAQVLAATGIRTLRRGLQILERRRAEPDRLLMLEALEQEDGWRARAAAEALASMNDLRFVDPILRRAKERGPGAWRGAASHSLSRLPSEVICPLARRWRESTDSTERHLAENVLSERARPEDRDIVRAMLESDGSDERVETAVTGLRAMARIGEPDDAELVERAYLDLLHTCNRWDGLDALARVSPQLHAIHAHDALWDCAGGVRWHAIRVSPPSSRDRLHEIASDPFEEEDHREAARKRLS